MLSIVLVKNFVNYDILLLMKGNKYMELFELKKIINESLDKSNDLWRLL